MSGRVGPMSGCGGVAAFKLQPFEDFGWSSSPQAVALSAAVLKSAPP